MSRKEKGMTSAELSSFCGQVALLLEAGLPIYEGMETLAEADSESTNADMYREVSRQVNEKGSLYEALKSDSRWPAYLVEMAGIGEHSGQLEKVMRGLEKFYAREDRIRSSVVSAVTYPLTLSAMLVLIVLVMLWKVLPVFRRVLAGMGMGMSGSGSALVRVGTAVGWIVLVVVGLLLIAVLVGLIMMKTSKRDQVLGLVMKLMPRVRAIRSKLSASRVASVLAMMLSGGFRVEEALEQTAGVLTDRDAAQKVEQIRSGMTEGKSFTDSLAQSRIFSDLENRMVRIGGATGHEDQVLDRIGTMYEQQVEEEISRMVGIIEPTLVALLCIVIGAVILSVMLPMAGMLSIY